MVISKIHKLPREIQHHIVRVGEGVKGKRKRILKESLKQTRQKINHLYNQISIVTSGPDPKRSYKHPDVMADVIKINAKIKKLLKNVNRMENELAKL